MTAAACARCGDCCYPAVLDPEAWDRIQAGDSHDDASYSFAREHWTVVGEQTDDGGYRMLELSCDRFDSDARLCAAHDDRPPICSGYPWYGREPGREGKVIPGRCSYWADLPRHERPEGSRPLIPVTAV